MNRKMATAKSAWGRFIANAYAHTNGLHVSPHLRSSKPGLWGNPHSTMGAIASSNNDRLLEDQENNKAREFPEYLESESKQAQSLGGRDLLTLEAQYSHYHSSDKRKKGTWARV